MNKNKEYRKMSVEQLKKVLQELKLESVKSQGIMAIAKLKSKKEGTKQGGSNLSKRIKKEIARVETIIKEKELKGGKVKNGRTSM